MEGGHAYRIGSLDARVLASVKCVWSIRFAAVLNRLTSIVSTSNGRVNTLLA